MPETQPLELPLWLPLSDAERLLRDMTFSMTQAGSLDEELHQGMRGGVVQAGSCSILRLVAGRGCLVPQQLLGCCAEGLGLANAVPRYADSAMKWAMPDIAGMGRSISNQLKIYPRLPYSAAGCRPGRLGAAGQRRQQGAVTAGDRF